MNSSLTDSLSDFAFRHLGPNPIEIKEMLNALNLKSLDQLVESAAPKTLLKNLKLDFPPALDEAEFLERAAGVAKKNKIFKSYIGQGYYDCLTPAVILRNILENPKWYTAYTPYQAEISQGRMEALLNFQTMICSLTGMEVANASLLDEGTAVAEAVSMAFHSAKDAEKKKLFLQEDVFTQTKSVLHTRTEPLEIKTVEASTPPPDTEFFAAVIQYPSASGSLQIPSWIQDFKNLGGKIIVACDLMALALLQPPGEWGADFVVGTSQRFGVPMGFGGPHAAFLGCKEEHKRMMPGRIIGVSRDAQGNPALRLALQTREQHIRREKATSNICTAQVLLAVMASMYAVYHGPEGIKKIAEKIHSKTKWLAIQLQNLGFQILNKTHFDTLSVRHPQMETVLSSCRAKEINLFSLDKSTVRISIDEAKTETDLQDLLSLFAVASTQKGSSPKLEPAAIDVLKDEKTGTSLKRTTPLLDHSVFNSYHSETEMLRYITGLEKMDLTLAHSMIPLGSCTMKLNATAEMIPVTWPEFGKLHPFAPLSQAQGYLEIFKDLESWLCQITGFSGCSLQPNAGSQGEYAGLLVIRKYFQTRSEAHRNICLIPSSAHGTNPASAVMAGFKVVVVKCDDEGNVDLKDLTEKALQHKDQLAALMLTYPSTHGVFEESISEMCALIHNSGGQVYMDGANLNALVGIARPGDFGPDVCHINLHKTFCIPHGGGGPGVGPIAVAAHLKDFLPTHAVHPECGSKQGISAVTSSPWGSASILPISWAYVAMMGFDGLKLATQTAILNANYIAKKLAPHFPVLYKNKMGFVAHECIIDTRSLKDTAGVTVDDIAKRLMDYGFHAPTMSWPVAGTLMIEPTESESKNELDRFCEALISIKKECLKIQNGEWPREDNPLKNAPHSFLKLTGDEWTHTYSRKEAGYPLPWVAKNKFWIPVSRVDNAFGDRNLVCTCPSVESYS